MSFGKPNGSAATDALLAESMTYHVLLPGRHITKSARPSDDPTGRSNGPDVPVISARTGLSPEFPHCCSGNGTPVAEFSTYHVPLLGRQTAK